MNLLGTTADTQGTNGPETAASRHSTACIRRRGREEGNSQSQPLQEASTQARFPVTYPSLDPHTHQPWGRVGGSELHLTPMRQLRFGCTRPHGQE